MSRETACAFTGHRPDKFKFGYDFDSPLCYEIRDRIHSAIEYEILNGITHFITGMALGVDMWAAAEVLTLRREYPQITLEAAIPCPSQADKWSKHMRTEYQSILERCDKKTVISPVYMPGVMQMRNRYMVDNSSVLIAVYNGTSGGTQNTIAYALSKDLRVVEISC
ncbi:MAG: SLOG family protein [Bacillota bacterium]|nr:SLOG family protein [Bacillota bacterium]